MTPGAPPTLARRPLQMRLRAVLTAITLALTVAGPLAACGGSSDATEAAGTKACRTFTLLAGDTIPKATAAVLHAAENGTYDVQLLRARLAPVTDASLKAGLIDGLDDTHFAMFRNLHRAAVAATPPLNGPFTFNDTIVSDLQKAASAEAATCG
jgi:hypothetical protein